MDFPLIPESYYADDNTGESAEREFPLGTEISISELESLETDYYRSLGPYRIVSGSAFLDVRLENSHRLLGFNASPLFGALQTPGLTEADNDCDDRKQIIEAYRRLIARNFVTVPPNKIAIEFQDSGRDAIQQAFWHCRKHQIESLAEHGDSKNRPRWNVLTLDTSIPYDEETPVQPINIHPNRSSELEFVVLPYPGHNLSPNSDSLPEFWHKYFSSRSAEPEFNPEELPYAGKFEFRVLQAIKQQLHLGPGETLAILVEPLALNELMLSARFLGALSWLAGTYDIPLIVDETKSGFGLGRSISWFQRVCSDNLHPKMPTFIVGEQRAGCGVLIGTTHLMTKPNGHQTEFESENTARFHLGYIQASVLEQYPDEIDRIEAESGKRLDQLASRFPKDIVEVGCLGLTATMSFRSNKQVKKFLDLACNNGLLLSTGEYDSVLMRFNLGFRSRDHLLFWERIEFTCEQVFGSQKKIQKSPVISLKKPHDTYVFHSLLHRAKRHPDDGVVKDQYRYFITRVRRYPGLESAKVVLLNRANYEQYRSHILELQEQVYEPARRTPAAEFDSLFTPERAGLPADSVNNSIAVLVELEGTIVAMALSGRLSQFKQERGVENDPWVDHPGTNYMVDLTVIEKYQGGLGSLMKQMVTLLAAFKQISGIHGRNRDRLARGMWSINLSLGAYEQKRLENDYPDELPFRDCTYYRCPLGPSNRSQGNTIRSAVSLDKKDEMAISINQLSRAEQSQFTKVPQPIKKENGLTRIAMESIDHGLNWLIRQLAFRAKPEAARLLALPKTEIAGSSLLAGSLAGEPGPYLVDSANWVDPSALEQKIVDRIDSGQYLALVMDTRVIESSPSQISGWIRYADDNKLPVILLANESFEGTSAGSPIILRQKENSIPFLCFDSSVIDEVNEDEIATINPFRFLFSN